MSTCNNNDVNGSAKSPLELNNKVLQLYGELTKHNSNLNFILNFTFNFLAKFNSDVLYRIGFNDHLISFEQQINIGFKTNFGGGGRKGQAEPLCKDCKRH